MSIKTYRYQRAAACSLIRLALETDISLSFVQAMGGNVVDLAIDESFKGDLDASMQARGYQSLGDNTTPITLSFAGPPVPIARYIEPGVILTSTSDVLEDMAGVGFDLSVTAPGSVQALLTSQTSSGGAVPSTGAWAISIAGADGTEIERYMSGSNDAGIVAVQSQSSILAAGSYTVRGRFRRVSGIGVVTSDVSQLSAIFYPIH